MKQYLLLKHHFLSCATAPQQLNACWRNFPGKSPPTKRKISGWVDYKPISYHPAPCTIDQGRARELPWRSSAWSLWYQSGNRKGQCSDARCEHHPKILYPDWGGDSQLPSEGRSEPQVPRPAPTGLCCVSSHLDLASCARNNTLIDNNVWPFVWKWDGLLEKANIYWFWNDI